MIKYEERYKYPYRAVLNITDDCVSRCSYCFVNQNPHYMTFETAKKAVDFVYKNYLYCKENNLLGSEDKAGIYFFGGEPTMLWNEIIVPILEYIEKTYGGKNFRLGITTSGMLLNKQRLDLLKQYNVKILLSCDGDEFTQNHNRPLKNSNMSSFEVIDKIIPELLERFPDACMRATIYGDTVDRLYENFMYAIKKGFKSCFFACDARNTVWDETKKSILEEQINKISYYILSERLSNGVSPIHFTNLEEKYQMIVNNDLNIKVDIINRCGLGTTGNVAINYLGYILSCQEQVTGENNHWSYIGNIDEGIDEEKHKKLLEIYSHELKKSEFADCNECKIKKMCRGGCPSTQKDLFNSFKKVSDIQCYYDNLLLNNAIVSMNLLVENNNKDFIEQLTKNMLGKENK